MDHLDDRKIQAEITEITKRINSILKKVETLDPGKKETAPEGLQPAGGEQEKSDV